MSKKVIVALIAGLVLIIGVVVLATSSDVVSQRASLSGTSWQWQLTEYSDQENVVANNPSEFVLTFNEDSRFGASTDCNQIGGNYEVDIIASEVSFSQMVSTYMACAGESQEGVFSGMLSQVESYEVTQTNELHLMLEGGGIMRFGRN